MTKSPITILFSLMLLGFLVAEITAVCANIAENNAWFNIQHFANILEPSYKKCLNATKAELKKCTKKDFACNCAQQTQVAMCYANCPDDPAIQGKLFSRYSALPSVL
ncbi:hypothetical protein BC936DRAFT_140670 [Jimgerdemannia flammicorona]|uniref:Uncharacterized protein n=2 Tax=Jimgerdemannia flammicorona TaxID=994334 RepID=A0A433DGN9_9FUNG|nr:hypothetical protein BC936DRAFT_140670 [Jimgerdemannia flammicorona]RUS33027.1 hypothetical protein BC938DRAFT_473460 [Jimgerdemannia flammicorona]